GRRAGWTLVRCRGGLPAERVEKRRRHGDAGGVQEPRVSDPNVPGPCARDRVQANRAPAFRRSVAPATSPTVAATPRTRRRSPRLRTSAAACRVQSTRSDEAVRAAQGTRGPAPPRAPG